MTEWKGTSVHIVAIEYATSAETHRENVLLDTDTMADIFEQFHPDRYAVAVISTEAEKAQDAKLGR